MQLKYSQNQKKKVSKDSIISMMLIIFPNFNPTKCKEMLTLAHLTTPLTNIKKIKKLNTMRAKIVVMIHKLEQRDIKWRVPIESKGATLISKMMLFRA